MQYGRLLANLALLLCLTVVSSAHGGHVRCPPPPEPKPPSGGNPSGPPRTRPSAASTPTSPGPAGPSAPGGLGPGGAGGLAGGGPGTFPGGGLEPDLTSWHFWWDLNKAPYLELKAHVHRPGLATGSDGFFLGDGALPQAGSLRPTEAQVRERVVPALLAVVEKETNHDLVTGALVALAKIGHADGLGEDGRFEAAVVRLLGGKNQEIRETAAVALGILASSRGTPMLANLLWDTGAGRELVRAGEVDTRTRAFAAYGLGLIGARTSSEAERQVIVAALGRCLERVRAPAPDLGVACVLALSLVPRAEPEPAVRREPSRAGEQPESSPRAQLEFLLRLLADPDRHETVRAHCPVALARLVEGTPPAQREEFRERVVEACLARIEDHRELPILVQSACLALGELGTDDAEHPLDARVREALMGATRRAGDVQTRAFALIALARSGARAGGGGPDEGRARVADFLIDQLLQGKGTLRPWAGLACGVLGHALLQADPAAPQLEPLRRAVRITLAEEKAPERLGAYAIAAGLLRDDDSARTLEARLAKPLQDDARGRVATGLALLGRLEARELVRGVLSEAAYRPELLRECAIALALLDDKEAAPMLVGLLQRASSMVTQTTLATALGYVGDQRSIEPLLEALHDPQRTERARGYAAVALGNVADKEALPWNAKVALGLNYRASTSTLTDPVYGGGILDIF